MLTFGQPDLQYVSFCLYAVHLYCKNYFGMFTFLDVQIYREDAHISSDKSSSMDEKKNPKEEFTCLYSPDLPLVWSTVSIE